MLYMDFSIFWGTIPLTPVASCAPTLQWERTRRSNALASPTLKAIVACAARELRLILPLVALATLNPTRQPTILTFVALRVAWQL